MEWWSRLDETAAALEIAWTLFALLWIPPIIYVLQAAIIDFHKLEEPRTEDLVLLGARDIAIDAFVLYLLVFFAWIGIRAMQLPPPAGGDELDPGIVAVSVGIIIAELAAGALVGWLAWTRHRVWLLGHKAVRREQINLERRAAMATALTAYREGRMDATEAINAMIDARERAARLAAM
jgi:hypothetical protein